VNVNELILFKQEADGMSGRAKYETFRNVVNDFSTRYDVVVKKRGTNTSGRMVSFTPHVPRARIEKIVEQPVL
jgi:hypothetical protein